MKVHRVLLFIIFTLFTSKVFSQFAPSVKINTEVPIDGKKNFCFGTQIVCGYRFYPTLLVGLGTGISYINLQYGRGYTETGAYVPLFATGKCNFIKKGISPYIAIDFGYSFLIPFSEYARKYGDMGIFINPHFGVDFPLSKGSLSVELGYKYQAMNEQRNYNQLTIALAYNF